MAITLDGTTGITTPGLSLAIENFSTTGNTTLGDASTDTLNVGNGGLVKDASGNVGIGTSSPARKLQVQTTGANSEILVTTVTSGNPRLGMDASGAYYNWIQTDRTSGAIQFAISNSESMRLDASGNFLVGTTSPSASYGRLTVSGTGISITPDTSAKLQIGRYGAGAPYSYIKMGSTSSGLKITDPADSVDLMTLDANGSFMIGGTTASGKLTVDPGSTSGPRIDGLHLPKNLTLQANYLAWQQGANGWRAGIPYGDNTYPLAFYYGASTPTASAPGTELMRIESNGYLINASNIGIGNTAYNSAWGTDSYQIHIGGSRSYSSVILANTTRTYSMGAGAYYHYLSYDHSAAAHNIIVNSTGVVALRGGAYSTATGVGIAFPATQAASSDANTLDDYEEGTWTPTMVQSGATFTYSYQTARYTKVGNTVTIMATLGWSAKSGGSGLVGIAGLPFANINLAGSYQQILCGDFYGFTFPSSSYTNMTAEIVTNTTTGNFVATGSAVSGTGVLSIGSTGLVFLQCTYLTN